MCESTRERKWKREGFGLVCGLEKSRVLKLLISIAAKEELAYVGSWVRENWGNEVQVACGRTALRQRRSCGASKTQGRDLFVTLPTPSARNHTPISLLPLGPAPSPFQPLP
jgi:hypothetical protein